ncbi:hypothetical protein [Streptomyces sp. ALB3]|uniref:hypothetical protein n=1 Tax=Streptomyces sp. ALB3 TaxID=3374278 RepID=UPI0037966F9F
MTITAVGLALTVPNWVSLLAMASLVAAIQLQTRVVEEPLPRSRARLRVRGLYRPHRPLPPQK